jgi:hypothetical protein
MFKIEKRAKRIKIHFDATKLTDDEIEEINKQIENILALYLNL